MIGRDEIMVRNEWKPGDLGYLVYLHGILYSGEYGYGPVFEAYVAESLAEFQRRYDPALDRVWICEHAGAIIGSLVIMHRENNAAQLRYFLLRPEYRGIGLGKKLMDSAMSYLREMGYSSCYLLTEKGLEAAASLYTRAGFVLTEERDSDIFGKPGKECRYEMKVD
ncbi:MAG TPA: GNAT family N-acetyltransferase [Treponema sp.]|nr:MAG: GNAT family N-acetyltransferase [Treponema sp. GWC1_61_84]OHE66719.1 MAG: GNAT family N-acetyltransferase [Treponema sp. GWA1_62_8]HCM26482.1 GNAT family N-acetyltransferase [Treponema sp.]